MSRGALVWWMLVGGWLLLVGGGVFAVVVPTYEGLVAGVLAERITAETTRALESVPLNAAVHHELAVPETLAGAPYQLGIDGDNVSLTVAHKDIETTVPLHGPEDVQYVDSQCRSEDTVRIVVEPAGNTTTVSLCGDH